MLFFGGQFDFRGDFARYSLNYISKGVVFVTHFTLKLSQKRQPAL